MLLVGPTGTGKTAYTQRYLMGLDPDRFTPPNFVGFSAQTSANSTQQLIDAKLDKRRKVRSKSVGAEKGSLDASGTSGGKCSVAVRGLLLCFQ